MKFKKLLLSLSAFAAASVLAQASLGTVTSVNGVATVTTGTSGAAIAPGAAIMHGSRVITTSNATVVLRLNNGCTVTVPPGHGVTVLSTMTCQQLTAAVQPVATTVTTTTAATTVPVGTGFVPNSGIVNGFVAAAAIGIAAGALMMEDDDDDAPLSRR
jgi:hypothetical protein